MAAPTTLPSTLGSLQGSIPSMKESEEKGPVSGGERTLYSSKARIWVTATIISTYLTAVVLAIIHHVFLAIIDRRDITQYSQEARGWIGGASNILSKVVSICLGVVVATALVQGVRISLIDRSSL
jgi:hypothetical protein